MPRTNYPRLIAENDEELAERERKLRGKATQGRVRMLRLLKAGTARSLPPCAPLVGSSERQLTRWWAWYRQGGLGELLAEQPRRGQTSRLHSEADGGLEEEMRAGRVATLEDARPASRRAVGHRLRVGQRGLVATAPTRGAAQDRPAAPRSGRPDRPGGVPSHRARSGCGPTVWLRRRWCPRGERPSWVSDERSEWLWVYVAVEPSTGRCCALDLPRVDPACRQIFLDTFRAEVGDGRVGLVLDGSGAHPVRAIAWPDGLAPLRLPPDSPELNPAEQIFRPLRARLANRICADLEDLDLALTAARREFWDDPPALRRLTGYPWWLDALASIRPRAS